MLDTFDLVKYAVACCKKTGMGVKWLDEGGVPHTDGKTMYIPRPRSDWNANDIIRFKRSLAHETSHLAHTDFRVMETVQPEGLERLIYNAIEDYRIDYKNDVMYEGDAFITEEAFKLHVDRFKSVPKNERSEILEKYGTPLMKWDVDNRDYMLGNDTLSEDMSPLMDEQGTDYYKKLRKYDAELRALADLEDDFEGSYQAAELSKKIAKEVFEIEPDPMPSRSEVAEGKGKDKEKGEQKGKGKKNPETGEGESDADGKAKEEMETGGGMYHDHDDYGMKESESDKEEREDNERERGFGGRGHGPYTPDPVPHIIDKTTDAGRDYPRAKEHLSQSISNRVRTLIQIATRSRTVFAQKRGKLNQPSLHRLMVDDQHYAERVFKKKVVNNSLDTAVLLLVDCSGSMSGEKMANAAAGAAMMNDVFNNVLHVKTEVLAFTEFYVSGHKHDVTVLYKMKDFDGGRVSKEAMCDKFGHVHMSNNTDGEALMYAYNRIKNRKEKRKMIFILSDGHPAGGYAKGDIMEYTKEVVKYIEHSPVELYAVGIEYDCSRLYKNAVKVNNSSQLEVKLLEVLKNAIVK